MPCVVLVVEDEPLVLEMAVSIFEDLGCTVLDANCAESALEVIRGKSHDIALLFTDVQMTGMDGRELARRACEELPNLRVVFASGQGPAEAGEEFMPKPYGAADLAKLVA